MQTIAPAIAVLNECEDLCVTTLAMRESSAVVDELGIRFRVMDESKFVADPNSYIRSLFEIYHPDLILSGFSPARGPAPETPEQFAILEAHQRGLLSIAVQDYWGMYAQRLSRDGSSLANDLLPTRLCILDRRAWADLESFGVPECCMSITHNPWLDRLVMPAAPVASARRSDFKGSIKVLLASQPLASMQQARCWPYNQYDIFEQLLTAMPGPTSANDLSTIQILPHPSEDGSRWNTVMTQIKRKDVKVELCNDRTHNLLRDVDYLVTSHSTLAYEALYFGTPCISLRPASEIVMRLWIEDAGLSRVFQEANSLRQYLSTSDPSVERQHVLKLKCELTAKGLFFSDGMATRRVVAEILRLLTH